MLTRPSFYKCNVTMANVSRASRPEQRVSDRMARLATAAIALQGYITDHRDVQYQIYPAESLYGAPQGGNATALGLMISRFAIGAIGNADLGNPTVDVAGRTPEAGVKLNVERWSFVYIILGLTGLGQLVLVVASACVANRVVVTDESHLAVARLLRPIVDRLGPSGCMLTGEEMAEVLGEEGGAPMRVVYSLKKDKARSCYHLDLGREARAKGPFPRGWYD